jgi:aldose 1-epimerase
MRTSGVQYTLASGDYTAEIASVGASLRALRFRDRDLVLAYGADEIRPRFRGAVLAPWANRVARGRWTWNATELQLPITEPERGHALHGLVAWSDWQVTNRTAETVTLTTPVVAQPGYPFTLRLAVTWSLDLGGLRCDLHTTNDSADGAPFGCSIHPYLVGPTSDVDSWILHVGASSELLVDESLIPTHLAPVSRAHDFRVPRPIGDAAIDHAFTGFEFHDGIESVTLTDADGDGARILFAHGTPWLQICTSDWPGRPGHRAGVAIEPMMSPPNAFATGRDLFEIPAGADHDAWWRIEAVTSHES